jgi:uncharacterized cupin superfamily protein
MPRLTNINSESLHETTTDRGEAFRQLDLSGDRLGVRVEELDPGSSSSIHHFHTAEEEHVIALAGSATLHVGNELLAIKEGDHCCFLAGTEVAHHIRNDSAEPFRFLVFGERNPHDVVVYPEHQVMLVKALGYKQFTYRPRQVGS